MLLFPMKKKWKFLYLLYYSINYAFLLNCAAIF